MVTSPLPVFGSSPLYPYHLCIRDIQNMKKPVYTTGFPISYKIRQALERLVLCEGETKSSKRSFSYRNCKQHIVSPVTSI